MNNLNELKPIDKVQNIIDKFCFTIGMIPTSYKLSLTYEEQILSIGKYLEETVIPAINNNAEAVLELQNLFIELKNYVDNYFDNLDIQNEIDIKLDEMTKNGTLENIMKPYFNEFNQSLINYQIETNEKIENSIKNISTGTPLVANNINEMTDTSRIYVNLENDHWYYFNGSNWTDGGVYQATEISNNSIGKEKTNFYSISNYNLFNKKTIIPNKFVETTQGILLTPTLPRKLVC